TAVSLAPRDAAYRIELAALLEQDGDFAGAERTYQFAVRVARNDLGAELAYGDFLARRRRFSEAVAVYERAAELKPDVEGALEGLGRCYWALDDRNQALSVMERLVELQPNNPAAKYDLALMLQRTGHPQEAIPLLDDVIRILPTMWEAVACKAGVLADLGRYWEARALYERAAELGAAGSSFEHARESLDRLLLGAPQSDPHCEEKPQGDQPD
ncbi:MAG: tetratricopeptide repeat protein, partial [Candidatus Eisenbacteria bacterium]|nr:tetratricopeptide repeat protein [Candidatus Eisenbacteria bacterium]